MSRSIVTVLFWFLAVNFVFGQEEKIINKTYPERYAAIGDIYIRAIRIPDSINAFEEVNRLKKLAIERGDKDMELETDLLKVYYLTFYHKNERVLIEYKIQKLLNDASAAKNLQKKTRAYKVLGDYYWFGLNNYELGFETYMVLEQLLQKISSRELPDKVYHLQNMAQAYHNFSDYQKALQLFHQIINLEVDNDPRGGYNSALYSIGKIHRQLGSLDSSDYYYHRILENRKTVNYTTWEGIAKGGLGLNHFLRGDYEAAIPYLQSDVDEALKKEDYGLAAGSLIPLADIFLRKNELQKAEQYALLARKCLSKADADRYKYYQDLYPVLSKLYSAKGVTSLVGPYLDSAIFAKDSITRQFNAMQMMRARQKIELQEHRAEIEKVDADKRLKTLERNMLIFIVLLIILASAYFIYYQRRRHREQQLQLAREVKLKEEELDNATRQLSEFARNISEKSKLIEHLELQQGMGGDVEILNQLRESTILTPEEWEYFKKLFEKVHVGYLQRLRQKFPDLTQSEIRFIALIKLGFGYQEMSSILGVSNHAVRTTKYRLLKKIDLPEDKSLEEVLVAI
jgi:DNA-binding CsgD family transcriptional regulator